MQHLTDHLKRRISPHALRYLLEDYLKFSGFYPGGALQATDIVVGLRDGSNYSFSPTQVLIGSDENPYAIQDTSSTDSQSLHSLLDVLSTIKGSRPFPRMTLSQRDAIASPDPALFVYTIDTNTLDYFNGSTWQTICTLNNLIAGDNIILTNNGDGTLTISAASGPPIEPPVIITADFDLDNSTAGEMYITDDMNPYTVSINSANGVIAGVVTQFFTKITNAITLIFGSGCTVNGQLIGTSFIYIINPGNQASIVCVDTNSYELITMPTWQQINDNDESNSFHPNPGAPFNINNYDDSRSILNAGDYLKIQGYNNQIILSSDLTLSPATVGVILVSDNLNSYTVTLPISAFDLDHTFRTSIITGWSHPVTISIPTGVTLNGIDGSIISTIVLNAGLQYAEIIRLDDTSYQMWQPGSGGGSGGETLQQVYNNSILFPVIVASAGLDIQDDSSNSILTVSPSNLSYQGGQKVRTLSTDLVLAQSGEGVIYISDDKAQHDINIYVDTPFTPGVSTFLYTSANYPITIRFDTAVSVNGFANYPLITIPPNNFGLELINLGRNQFAAKLVNPYTKVYVPTYISYQGKATNITNISSFYYVEDILPGAWVDYTVQFYFNQNDPESLTYIRVSTPFGANFTQDYQATLVGGNIVSTADPSLISIVKNVYAENVTNEIVIMYSGLNNGSGIAYQASISMKYQII